MDGRSPELLGWHGEFLLGGRRVRVRGIEPADWSAFMQFDGYAEHQRSVDGIYPPRSAEGYRAWAREQAVALVAGDCFQLAIETVDGGELVGSLSTHGADPRAGRFGYGIGIGGAHQRRGYATEAVALLLRFMFGERRYHKCEARIYAYNEASLALHRTVMMALPRSQASTRSSSATRSRGI